MKRASLLNRLRRNGWKAAFISALMIGTMTAPSRAGTAEDDWRAVVALDAGPQEPPKSVEAASAMVVAHVARQEKILRGFLAAHPQDSHAFEAQLRLARALQIRADFEHSDTPRTEARRLLDGLDKTATPEQRPELEFAKVARMMRALNRADPAQCEELLHAARRFQSAYPTDRRVAALLTEVATLFDSQPSTKEALLEDAFPLAKEGDLRARISDDLKRVRLMGQAVPLNFTSIQGQEINLEKFADRPVFVIFFGEFSTASMAGVSKLEHEVAELPAGSVRVIGVSLDVKRETVISTVKTRALTWPVAFDGKGWESPLVRGLGINAVPTVWLIDAHARLRSLNALEGAAILARQLLQER
jgi:peroxiredoxin